jgi:hypothetical protein
MDHSHTYDCIVCGAHFDDSKSLTAHNESAHLRTATGMERPRHDGAIRDTTAPDATTEPAVDPAYAHDRNPRQGFDDPRTDASRKT